MHREEHLRHGEKKGKRKALNEQTSKQAVETTFTNKCRREGEGMERASEWVEKREWTGKRAKEWTDKQRSKEADWQASQ